MRSPWLQTVVLALAWAASAGCSSPAGDVSGASTSGAGTGGGGGAPEAEPALYVSFVAEQGPGSGPAMLRMVNDTDDQILSLTMPNGEAFAFYLVEPMTSSDYALIASDDMLEDAILSLHTLDTCVRKQFSEMNGPLSLEPGRAYAIHVAAGFAADIVEEPRPGAFVGLRSIIHDPAKSSGVGAASTLFASGADTGDLVFEDIYDELPAPFLAIDAASVTLDELRFVDLAGIERSAVGPFVLDGAFGYTAYVANAPVEGAALQIGLE